VRHVVSLIVAIGILISGVATAKCSVMSTRDRFLEAETVVLVSIINVRDGPVPWPYGISRGSLPGKLLALRVIKSWKGSDRSEDILHGWTLAPNIEHAYLHTDVGTQLIVFYRKDSPHEILSCNAVNPDRLIEVSQDLDAIANERAGHEP
jgi:hypothetical protein